MAATMAVVEVNEASYTPGTTGTNKVSGTVTFGSTNAVSSTPPVVRGASDVRSFDKWLHMRASGTGFSISNPRFYADSSGKMATGVTFYALTTNTNTYAQPTAASVRADGTGTDLTTLVVGARKDMDTANATGPWTVAGDIGDFLVLWAKVASTSGPGAMTISTVTMTFTWDEA